MNNFYDVIIAGGGASGIFCAIKIKMMKPSLSVAILEKQQRIGKKLLATGNGRCNLTNTEINESLYHGSFKFAISELIEKYSPEIIINEFREMGLLTTTDSTGRVYPLSKQASSVLDVLRINLKKHNVDVITECEVLDINKSKGSFTVKTNSETYSCRQLVISTGSKATPALGSDSKMLNIVRKSGHNSKALSPALCPVSVSSPYLKSLKGIRANGTVRLITENQVLKEESGEIQFTENALSGICIFNLSGLANTRKNTEVSISLLPDSTPEEITEILIKKKNILPLNSAAEELFTGIFHKMIGIALLKECNISPAASVENISIDEIKKLSCVINDWRFRVIPSDDFSKAQVTAGGIFGKEIDMNTMESQLVKGLYFTGEIIDIYGDCGGLNLHFAFMSASAAAKRICELC